MPYLVAEAYRKVPAVLCWRENAPAVFRIIDNHKHTNNYYITIMLGLSYWIIPVFSGCVWLGEFVQATVIPIVKPEHDAHHPANIR